MLTTLNVIIAVLLVAVVGVLVAGLLSMRGGTTGQPGRLSNRLMRWRVVLQFAAVMLIALTAWLAGRH